MTLKSQTKRVLDPDDDAQMDDFNNEFDIIIELFGCDRDANEMSIEQAAEYLGLSSASVRRYAYTNLLDLVPPSKVTVDSVISYKLFPRYYRIARPSSVVKR